MFTRPADRLPSRLLLATALVLGLTPVASRADEPAATTAPSATDASPLAEANARFQTLLEQLRPYNIPHLDELAAEPTATTSEELAGRLDRLYAETGFQSANRYRTYENNLRALTDERVRLEEARADSAKLEQDIAAAPARLKAAEEKAAQALAQAESAEQIAVALHANAAALEEDFLAARNSTLASVYYLLPTNQRVSFHEGTQKNAANPAYAVLPEVESNRGARLPAASPKPAAPLVDLTNPIQPPAPVSGSLEAKFAAFEDKQRALRNLAALLPPQEKQLAAARELADTQVMARAALNQQLAEYAGPLAQQAATVQEAEDRLLTAQVNQKIAAGNLLRLGTAALLWHHLKATVVAPLMEQFLADNGGLAKGRSGTALLDEIAQRPQDFIPKKGTYENPQPLSALRLRLLDVEPNLETRATAAAEALAAGKITRSDALVARFFKDLDKPGVAVLQATTDTLTPGQKKLAAVLLERAPVQ